MLLQEIVSLLLVKVVACLVAYLLFQVLQLDFAVQNTHRVEHSLLDAVHHEQLHLLLDAERHVGTDEVQCHDVVSHVVHSEVCLLGQLIVQPDILLGHLTQVLHGCLELTVALLRLLFRNGCYLSHQIGTLTGNLIQMYATHCLDNGRDITVG